MEDSKTKPSFHIEVATPTDLPACMAIRIPCFASIPLERALWGDDSPATRAEACTRHLEAWKAHEALYGVGSAKPIKAVHTDPMTGEETIVGYAEWYFYPKPTTATERPPHPLLDPALAPVDKRALMQEWLDPVNEARERLMGDEAYATLMYMGVDPAWRRRGVSTMCVRWGMDRCDEMGVPAWLEASAEGKFVYEGLGWEVVTLIQCPEMQFPGMVYRPKGWEGARS